MPGNRAQDNWPGCPLQEVLKTLPARELHIDSAMSPKLKDTSTPDGECHADPASIQSVNAAPHHLATRQSDQFWQHARRRIYIDETAQEAT